MVDPFFPGYATGLRRIAEGLTEQPIGVIVRTLYNVIDEEIDAAVQQQRQSGGKLGDILLNAQLDEEQATRVWQFLSKRKPVNIFIVTPFCSLCVTGVDTPS